MSTARSTSQHRAGLAVSLLPGAAGRVRGQVVDGRARPLTHLHVCGCLRHLYEHLRRRSECQPGHQPVGSASDRVSDRDADGQQHARVVAAQRMRVPTYTDVQRIFNKSCIECHGGLGYPPYSSYGTSPGPVGERSALNRGNPSLPFARQRQCPGHQLDWPALPPNHRHERALFARNGAPGRRCSADAVWWSGAQQGGCRDDSAVDCRRCARLGRRPAHQDGRRGELRLSERGACATPS